MLGALGIKPPAPPKPPGEASIDLFEKARRVQAKSPGQSEYVKAIREKGTGVIGMKVMGEGQFRTPEQRDASIKFVLKLGTVDAITIGYKSTAEIDEAIERVDTHLNS